jgi:hypothetical protein
MPIVALIALTLGSGCYAGRTPSKKTANYVGNGFGVVAGAALIVGGLAESHSADHRCDNVNEGTACGFGSLGSGLAGGTLALLGGSMVAASIAMTILTLALPTEPEPVRAPTTHDGETTGLVRAPGLKPVSVTLR